MLALACLMPLASFMMKNQVKANFSADSKILFIHHSTGGNLIREGNVRDEIRKIDAKIEFWDHNYNLSPILGGVLSKLTHLRGLTDDKGQITGTDYKISLSNNSPREYAEIFSREPSDITLASILSYDVIAFKNCYPTTRIVSEEQLQQDIEYYKAIRESLKKYPNKKFVLLTPPPARKSTTNVDNAKRATQLVDWLKSDEFLDGKKNIYVFDFFGLLSDENGFLKPEYERFAFWDSHPNRVANQTVAPIFAKYLVDLSR